MEDSTGDSQITRLKLYYHHQLQQKEKQICTLISHQKIALSKLRKTLDDVPIFTRTSCYLELASKLKGLEVQHEILMQEYSKNHVFVTALLYGTNAEISPGSTLAEERRSSTSRLIAASSKPMSGSDVLPYNNYPILSSYSVEPTRNGLHATLVSSRKNTTTNNSSRQTAACNLIKTLPSSSSSSSASPAVLKRVLSGPDDALQSSGSLSIPSALPPPSLPAHPVPSSCALGRSLEFAQASNLSPVQPLLPPPPQQQQQNQQLVSSDSAITLTDDSPSGSSLDSSSTVFLPPFSACSSSHPPIVSGPSQTQSESNWLIASPSAMANDVYTPAFDWNSERLPDFSVWS